MSFTGKGSVGRSPEIGENRNDPEAGHAIQNTSSDTILHVGKRGRGRPKGSKTVRKPDAPPIDRMSKIDVQMRLAELEKDLLSGKAHNVIKRDWRLKYGWKYTRTEKYLRRISDMLRKQSESSRPYKKAQAEARIQSHIEQAAKTRSWVSVQGFEAQLAKIQGTEEPLTVHVAGSMQSTITHLLADMSPETILALAAVMDRALNSPSPLPGPALSAHTHTHVDAHVVDAELEDSKPV